MSNPKNSPLDHRPQPVSSQPAWSSGCLLLLVLLLFGLSGGIFYLGPELFVRLGFQQPATTPDTAQASTADLTPPDGEAAARLNSYGWVDQGAEVVRLPIEQAMALIAERGLPIQGSEPAAGEQTLAVAPSPTPTAEPPTPTPDEATPPAIKATPTLADVLDEPSPPTATPIDVLDELPTPTPTVEDVLNELPTPTVEEATGVEPTPTPEPPPTEPPAPVVDLANVSFQNHVLPIFDEHCTECHADDNPEEGLLLTSYEDTLFGSWNGEVIVPGDPDDSYLVEQVVNGRMPKKRDPLSPQEIEIIIAWVEAGAPDN